MALDYRVLEIQLLFLTLDAILARHLLSSGLPVCLSVRPSVRLSQAGIVPKRLEESSWF